MIPNILQLMPRVQVLPGPSDHDAVHCKVIIHPQKRKRFNASLALATAIPNANVLNGGDLNFPSWDWKLKTLKPKPACPRLHHEFITMLND